MADLSELAKFLQEQVNIVTAYLNKEKLSPPSFIPSDQPTSINSLPPEAEEARRRVHSLSWSIHQLVTAPSEHIWWTACKYHDSIALRVIIEKRIAFIIPIFSEMPLSDISKNACLPEDRLVCLLRQLTAVNIFREPSPRVFAHTSASVVLTDPEFAYAMDLILHKVDVDFKIAGYFSEALDLWADKMNNVQKSELRTAFNLAFKTDHHFFDYIYSPKNISRYGERFNRGMVGETTELLDEAFDLYDWTVFNAGDKIVDIGGGLGHVGANIAGRVKSGVEIVVQDQPSVIEQGRTILDSVTFQPYDFFHGEQPVIGAKVYYLRHILHDWPDEICRTILRPLHHAMDSDSKLLICELVVKDDSFWAIGKNDKDLIDGWGPEKRHWGVRSMTMSMIFNAKERTDAEWHELLDSAGFKVCQVYGYSLDQSIIEAVKQ